MEETEYLHAIWLERKQAWMQVEDVLRASISGERAKGRGSVMRENFINRICMMANKPFKSYDDEIENRNSGYYIEHYWSYKTMKNFTKEERKIINETLLPLFGPLAKMSG